MISVDCRISYPFLWEEIDPKNDNVDVCVTFEDGRSYTLTVATPDNAKGLMDKASLPYLPPSAPFLFVETLTQAHLQQLVESLLNDPPLPELYGSDLCP